MGSVRDKISKNLLFYRKKSNLTQKEFAELLGVKNSSVSNWENGLNSIDIETLYKACEIFGISVSEMYGMDNNEGIKKHETISVSKKDSEIISYFKLLSEEQKKDVATFIKYLKDKK